MNTSSTIFRPSELFSLGTRLCLERLMPDMANLDAPDSGPQGDILCLAALVLEAQAQGHLCLPVNNVDHFLGMLLSRWMDLNPENPVKPDLLAIKGRLDRATGLALASSPLFLEFHSSVLGAPLFAVPKPSQDLPAAPFLLMGGVFFTNRQYERDMVLSEALASRLARPRRRPVQPYPEPEAWVLPLPGKGTEKDLLACAGQSRAVEASRGKGLFVLSGGPGTGKTTTVFHMLRAAWLDGIRRVGLAAPTGRAAQRLQESLKNSLDRIAPDSPLLPPGFVPWFKSLEASTVHRYAGRGRPLGLSLMDLELLVVDEASMMDADLSGALLLGLDPQASLILVGDHRQLPSVDEGALMADLWRLSRNYHGENWFAQLTVSLRADGTVLDIPGMIARDEPVASIMAAFKELPPCPTKVVPMGEFWTVLPSSEEEKAWQLHNESQKKLSRDMVGAMQKEFLSALGKEARPGHPDPVQEALSRVVLLSPVRKGLWGVEELNRAMVDQWTGAKAEDSPMVQGIHVFEGMPLMVSSNDQGLGIFNGERGLAHVCSETGLWYLYFTANRRVPLAQIADLEPSFAMTIHKSQGSEFLMVHLVLDESVCTRELLYTGLTRAVNGWHVHSPLSSLEASLSSATVRYSFLEDHIRSRLLNQGAV